MSATARQATSGALLYALEQTLRQAADHAVASSASASLGPAVNHAASAIENFTQAQIQQMEERLAQRHLELVNSAREQISAQVQSALADAEDRLRKRSTEYVEEAADNAHRDFTQRLIETSNQVSARVAEDAIGSSAQHFAKLAYGIHATAAEAQSRIESSANAIADSHASAKSDLDRAHH